MQPNPIVAVRSTDALPKAERFAYWADVVTQTFVPLECDAPDRARFRGDIRHRQVGLIGIAEVTASALGVRRTSAAIARGPRDDLIVVLQLAGTCRTGQGAVAAELAAGEGAAVATDEGYFFEFPGRFRQLVLKVPASLLPEERVRPAHRRPLKLAAGPARLLQKLAASSLEDPDAFSSDETLGIERALVELLRAASTPARPPEGDAQMSLRYARACVFIRQNLADGGLNPAVVAAELNMSTRNLARLFAQQGTTIERAIWTARLAAAQRDLIDPRLLDRSITDIAFSWAFNDAAHFSRSFSRTYGITPRAFRLRHARLR
jgi:AraC-like DNA-binding protein